VLDDAWVQQRLEPGKLLAVCEDDRGDVRPLRRPKRSSSAPFTSGSSSISWWTISSLEIVAAP
jgi:hypothetical protein